MLAIIFVSWWYKWNSLKFKRILILTDETEWYIIIIINWLVRLVMEKIGEAAGIGKAVDLNGLLPFFTNDIMCNIVSGKLFKEEGRNKLFRKLTDANSKLLGGFNLEDYDFPSMARLGVVRRWSAPKLRR